MNTKYPGAPELIVTPKAINSDGDESYYDSKIASIQVISSKDYPSAIAQLDIHDFKKRENLIIEIELHELVSALSFATLNAERD